jgi:uncharacterized protein YkwD
VSLADQVQQIVDLTNQMRAQNGLPPLTVDPRLAEMAQIHARDMAQFDVMAHTLPQAAQPDLQSRAAFVGYSFTALGENIAFDYPGPQAVVNGWMGSDGHRANILDPGYTQIGVGVALDGYGLPYYCQVFGQPQ